MWASIPMSDGMPGKKPCSFRSSATEYVMPASCAAVGALGSVPPGIGHHGREEGFGLPAARDALRVVQVVIGQVGRQFPQAEPLTRQRNRRTPC